jgi:hypothetical protein
MHTYGHWISQWEIDINSWVGFCYKITNLDDCREYIGKKFFWSSITKKVKDTNRKKHIVKESGWRSYTGSCKQLTDDIARLGKDHFEFEILSLHESKSSLAYREVELQIQEEVIYATLPDGSRKYYNGYICPIKFKVNKPTEKELLHR